ncbi:hypothetical protein CAT37_15030 [Acinetobacter pittii]|uniref:DUF4848 domain-containing protein n=1 Tax=Acinetobacter pittii TaxID=48296 RepID=UPI000A37714B|nr:DUF4848 domain-containing protein [Acinetobacter pittii]OTU42142.1 hypothetical protein CAT37_15030 [Acinetobacter pittii]
MNIKFDFLIESEEFSIDMKTGLESLQGVSDTFRLIGEALLTDDLAERKTHRNDVRTNLEKNFKGSYGQIFSLEPHDKEAVLALQKMGKDTFAELVNYILSEALYEDSHKLSDKAQDVLESLSQKTIQQLMKKLRNPLRNLHKINRAFGYSLKIRYRKYANDPVLIQVFNAETYEALNAVESKDIVEINAAITRINIKNGNGRIKIDTESKTLAFGFGKAFESLPKEIKKIFSSNLDNNMGVNQENWEYLKLKVYPVKLGDGSIVKYVFKEFA